MEKNWTKVRTYTNEIKSEFLKQILEQNDIPTVVMNKKDSSYLFGKIEIYVSDSLVAQAEKIIEEFESEKSLNWDED